MLSFCNTSSIHVVYWVPLRRKFFLLPPSIYLQRAKRNVYKYRIYDSMSISFHIQLRRRQYNMFYLGSARKCFHLRTQIVASHLPLVNFRLPTTLCHGSSIYHVRQILFRYLFLNCSASIQKDKHGLENCYLYRTHHPDPRISPIYYSESQLTFSFCIFYYDCYRRGERADCSFS